VYKTGATPALGVTGTLTLDGQGDPNAVFVFQVGSALTTAVNSHVNLINGAQPGNVFWQIGSSATLGTSSTFAGSILALTSISVNDGVTLNGRALARNGAVTLIGDTINVPSFTPPPPPPPCRLGTARRPTDAADTARGRKSRRRRCHKPTVSVAGPAWDNRAGTLDGGVWDFTANAAEPLSGVTNLEVFVDGVSESQYDGLITKPCPNGGCPLKIHFALDIDALRLTDGQHQIRVSATSGAGVVGSTSWQVTTRQAAGPCTSPRFTPYNAGAKMDGMSISDVHRTCQPAADSSATRNDDVTYTYGSCDPSTAPGDACTDPIEVQSAPLCERHAAIYAASPEPDGNPYPINYLTIRGVPAASYENGSIVEIYAGNTTITVRGTNVSQVSDFLNDLVQSLPGDIPSTVNTVFSLLPSGTLTRLATSPLPLPDPAVLASPTSC